MSRRGLARRSDPPTAHAAAAAVDANEREAEVLEEVREHGPGTSVTLAARMDLPPWNVSPRMKPLEKKGLVYGLRAVHRVLDRYPGLRVRMVGDGPLRPEIETEIEALGMGDRVDLLGLQPHAACLEELHRATVLLHPSVTAGDGDTEGGAPVALIEAMASGLPVVSSLHADIPTIVPHEKCGLLFRERDVEGLAEGLDAILGSEELRDEMGREGRAHVEANHDRRVLGGRLEGIYDRVVGGKI